MSKWCKKGDFNLIRTSGNYGGHPWREVTFHFSNQSENVIFEINGDDGSRRYDFFRNLELTFSGMNNTTVLFDEFITSAKELQFFDSLKISYSKNKILLPTTTKENMKLFLLALERFEPFDSGAKADINNCLDIQSISNATSFWSDKKYPSNLTSTDKSPSNLPKYN